MVLDKPSRPAQDSIPDIKGCPKGRPIIGCSCRDIDVFKRRLPGNLAIGHRIHGHAPRHTEVFTFGFIVKAKINDVHMNLRIGQKGSAKIYGDRTVLIYYLLRKPLIFARTFIGL